MSKCKLIINVTDKGNHCMSTAFEWDENKARSNLSKHKVSFDEAKRVFDDPFYIDFYDPDHSDDEERYFSTLHMY